MNLQDSLQDKNYKQMQLNQWMQNNRFKIGSTNLKCLRQQRNLI